MPQKWTCVIYAHVTMKQVYTVVFTISVYLLIISFGHSVLFQISHKPTILSHTEAATMPFVGATCWAALCTLGLLQPRSMIGKRSAG